MPKNTCEIEMASRTSALRRRGSCSAYRTRTRITIQSIRPVRIAAPITCGSTPRALCRAAAPKASWASKQGGTAVASACKEGEPESSTIGRSLLHAAEVNSAISTVVEKKSCGRQAWLMLPGLGSMKITVMPPSKPCAITAASAIQPSRRIQRRPSARDNQIARIIVSSPTVVATMRWPCSKITPPSILGISLPYERGQSGTERPASLLEGGVIFERSEEHTSELQSHLNLVYRLLLEK